jgi:hypothetical protein
MYAKIEDGKIIFPPHNDGNKINVHLDPAWLAEHGFRDMSEEELAPYWPKPEEQTVFTKLAIRRAMRELGIEPKLDALLDASGTFRADWTDAQDIDLADPVLLEALASGGLSENEIAQIRNIILNEGSNAE